MFILSLRPVLPAAILALSLAGLAPRGVQAQSSSLDKSYAIGLAHASKAPYNYTGRIFNVGDSIEFGSGTLIRRHTVLTAGHVVYDPTVGFLTYGTFNRGLYEDFTYQKTQIVSAQSLTGYQAAADTFSGNSIEAFTLDMGIVLIQDAPRDGSWGNYQADPTLLSDLHNQFFVVGYPGVTFDGRTMAYIVPHIPFVPVGPAGSALYQNDGYSAEPGESGGPVYIFDGVNQIIVAETVGGIDDSSGEFNASFVRAIDKAAEKFITSAEYASGLIRKVRIKGPRTVSPGTKVIFKVRPIFTVPDVGSESANATTGRYTEIRLKTSTPGTSTQPAVTIRKISYTKFEVTFDESIRPKTTTTLSAFYTKTQAVPDSTVTLTFQ